ncbi:hypothetical protein [Aeromonas phage PZL-Ah1]|nr:hypothetical protein [Aeromonas phage PZL-Ah1]
MRSQFVIESEIAKLQAELEDVKAHESKVIAASHILTNLGWTWTRKDGWKKPVAPIKPTVFDKDTMTHIKKGDFCLYAKGTVLEGFVMVREVNGAECTVSYVSSIAEFNRPVVSKLKFRCHANMLKVVSSQTLIDCMKNNMVI